MKSEIRRARALLARAISVAVVSHVRPDGDAVGSLLAFSLSLEQAGIHATPVLMDGLPSRFRFLPGADRILRALPEDHDLLVALDCADAERLGIQPGPERPHVDLNIDHHATNTHFAAVNLVEPAAAATAEVLHGVLPQLRLPLTRDVALNLLAGLLADTIGFRTASVTAKTLRIAAELMDWGAPMAQVYQSVLGLQSFFSARYWGTGLSRLAMDDGLVWTTLLQADREKVGYAGFDDADLINLLSNIEGARVAVVFVEQPGQRVKVSWRSRDGLDVSSLAIQFGGGGHEPAAGAMIEGKLEVVQDDVLSATRALLVPTLEAER